MLKYQQLSNEKGSALSYSEGTWGLSQCPQSWEGGFCPVLLRWGCGRSLRSVEDLFGFYLGFFWLSQQDQVIFSVALH